MAERMLELTQMGQKCLYYMYTELASPGTLRSTRNQPIITWGLRVQLEGPGLVAKFRKLVFPGDLTKDDPLQLLLQDTVEQV